MHPIDVHSRTDDEHRMVLDLLPADLFDLDDLEAGIERILGLLAATPVELPDDVAIDDHVVTAADGHEITVRIYRPDGLPSSSAALYWIHGGGLVLGDVTMDDATCAAFARDAGLVVASVDYRLAPQFPYPTPLDDCRAGYLWLVAEADRLGIAADRLAVGGASAGGGLAASLVLSLRDRGEHLPRFQLLRYPMIDDRLESASSHEIVDGRVWNRSANLAGWTAYLGDRRGTDAVEPWAAASRATDLSGLPPAIVTVGELDLFRDEDVDYARRLLQAGVACELHVYPNAFHASDVMVAFSSISQRWREDEIAAVTRNLL